MPWGSFHFVTTNVDLGQKDNDNNTRRVRICYSGMWNSRGMALAIAAALTSAPFFCRSDTEEAAALAWDT